MIDDDDKKDTTLKKIPKKTATRKVNHTRFKPSLSKPGEGLKKGLTQKSLKKSASEKNDLQRRMPRRAAAAAKSYIEVIDENDEPKKGNKNSMKVFPNKGL